MDCPAMLLADYVLDYPDLQLDPDTDRDQKTSDIMMAGCNQLDDSPFQPLEFTLEEINLTVAGNPDGGSYLQPVTFPNLSIYDEDFIRNDNGNLIISKEVVSLETQDNSTIKVDVSKEDSTVKKNPCLVLANSAENFVLENDSLKENCEETSPNSVSEDMDYNEFSDLIVINKEHKLISSVPKTESLDAYGKESLPYEDTAPTPVDKSSSAKPPSSISADRSSEYKSIGTHRPRNQGLAKLPFVCGSCSDRRFKLKAYLTNHALTHLSSPVPVFECNEQDCTAVYRTRPALTTHINRNHRRNSIEKSKCPNCHRSYTNPSYLHHKHLKACNAKIYEEMEVLRNTANPPSYCPRLRKPQGKKDESRKETFRFKCIHPGCTARYDTAEKLNHHGIIHEKVRVMCDFCTKTYAKHQQLNIHIQKHHADKIEAAL